MNKLPPWPDIKTFGNETPYGLALTSVQGWDYERARADAAMARLRVAVEALKKVHELGASEYGNWYITDIPKALAEIGELPE